MAFNESDFCVEPGTKVNLNKMDAGYGGDLTKKQAKKELDDIHLELFDLQTRLFAESKQALLIVLQAMDAGGKDGTIRDAMQGFNPQGCRVVSFRVPNSVEIRHDFLWRIHRVAPAHGEITIFNRSHYGDILAVGVHGLLPEERWKKRYEHINNFEKMLRDDGIRTIKFYLHISKDEQKRKLDKRVNNPLKHWKFSKADFEERKHWDRHMEAFEQVLERCSTQWAPWYVVPSDNKWYRNWVVGQIIAGALRDMNPQFPEPSKDLHEFLEKAQG